MEGAPIEVVPSEGTGGRVTRAPLFGFDPGWPFVVAGLALIVSAVLIPAQRELHDLEQELAVHQAHEERANAELLAYNQFLADVARGDERLLERLVRAQLNRMPKDERPLLLMPSANDTVPTWIESSVTAEIPEPAPYPDTLLSRLATGPRRLWVLATGAFLVFIGVMFAPAALAPRRSRARRPQVVTAVVLPSVPEAAAVIPATQVAAVVIPVPEIPVTEVPSDEVAEEPGAVVEPEVLEAVSDMTSGAPRAVDEPKCESVCESVCEPVCEPVCESEGAATLELSGRAEPPLDGMGVDEGDDNDGNLAVDPAEDEIQYEDAIEDPAEDIGEEVARAETEAMRDAPEPHEPAEARSDLSSVEIETFAHSMQSIVRDPGVDSMSLFSGLSDDRWIDTRAR